MPDHGPPRTTDADPEFGAGCHPRREVALCRALTEAAQARTTYIVGARDDLASELYEARSARAAREEARALFEGPRPGERLPRRSELGRRHVDDDVDEFLRRLQLVGIA